MNNIRVPMTKYIPIESMTRLGGVRHVYRLPNGLEVSVVMNELSFGGPEGLWEAMPLTEDMETMGYLTDQELEEYLDEQGTTH